MAPEHFSTSGISDVLVILGAAGIVIPAFARFKISPVIGFILIGLLVGPSGLGALAGQYPWLNYAAISNREAIEQAELVEDAQSRGMDGVAAKIAQEIRMLLKHDGANAGAREQQPGHHPRRTATGNQQVGLFPPHGLTIARKAA